MSSIRVGERPLLTLAVEPGNHVHLVANNRDLFLPAKGRDVVRLGVQLIDLGFRLIAGQVARFFD